MDDENGLEADTLDELDDEPVLVVAGRNFFGWPKDFRFFNVHLEYKNFWGRKREIPYNMIKNISHSGGKIYIKISDRILPVVFAVRGDIDGICQEIKKIVGVK